jgi:hypothetical protein
VNGIRIVLQEHTGYQGIAILLRRDISYAQTLAQNVTRQTGVPATAIAAGDFQSIRPLTAPVRQRMRPAQGGVSIGHYKITAGTLGCLVRDGKGGTYILSNNHVLANSQRKRTRSDLPARSL